MHPTPGRGRLAPGVTGAILRRRCMTPCCVSSASCLAAAFPELLLAYSIHILYLLLVFSGGGNLAAGSFLSCGFHVQVVFRFWSKPHAPSLFFTYLTPHSHSSSFWRSPGRGRGALSDEPLASQISATSLPVISFAQRLQWETIHQLSCTAKYDLGRATYVLPRYLNGHKIYASALPRPRPTRGEADPYFPHHHHTV
jgi:hypothetical protein